MFSLPNKNKIKNTVKQGTKNTVRASIRGSKDAQKTIKEVTDHSKKKKSKSPDKKNRSLFDMKSFLAPDGANPTNTNHFELNDNGVQYFCRSFYISELPVSGNFAQTFDAVFGYKDLDSTIYVEPIRINDAISSLDNDLSTIEAEQISANKESDTNRYRKLNHKYNEAQSFQSTLETRQNKMFNVAFVFTIKVTNLEQLDRSTADLVYKAKDSGIELVSFYGNQIAGFKLNKPFNNPKIDSKMKNMLIGVKWHSMDLYSLSTIYAHTSSEFYHENGLIIGRNILTGGHPVSFDIHDESHKNQNIFFAGASGAGKSSTVKKLIRLYSTIKDQKFAVLDVENIKGRGEYSDIVDAMGGYRFELKANSSNVINPFEISDEDQYDFATGDTNKTLKLVEKIPYTSNIILSLISVSDNQKHSNVMVRIVNDIVFDLYRGIGLVEGDAESLYTISNVNVEGKIVNQKVKKNLPTLSSFFKEAVCRKLDNKEPLYHKEYIDLIAGLSNYIREVHVCEHGCGTSYSIDEVNESNARCPNCNGKISSVVGPFNFFDGETTCDEELNFDNYPIISIDVSSVPKEYLDKAMVIGMNYINESLIKRNSEDPMKAKNITVINDEQHKSFVQKENRDMIIYSSRVYRKRNAGIWSLTQSVNDYTLYDEAKTIVTQSDVAFILKHKNADRESLSVLLDDVNASDLNFITSANRGDIFLSAPIGKARVKIDLLDIEMKFANTDLNKERELRHAEAK